MGKQAAQKYQAAVEEYYREKMLVIADSANPNCVTETWIDMSCKFQGATLRLHP